MLSYKDLYSLSHPTGPTMELLSILSSIHMHMHMHIHIYAYIYTYTVTVNNVIAIV